MKIFCALCDGYIGELSGSVVKGTKWLVVHEHCLYPKPDKDSHVGDSSVDWLFNQFGMKK